MTKKRKAWTKPDAERKSLLLQVRLTAQEKAAFEEVAKMTGEGVSSWARRELRRFASEKMKAAGKDDPFLA